MKKTSTLVIILIVLIAVLSILFVLDQQKIKKSETNKEQPVEDINVEITNPKPNQVIESPLEVRGNIKGSWLFEASTSVVLTDWDGRIISEGYIQTTENWMTTDLVPFSGTLEFETPEDIGDFSDMGNLIIQKANPSGLPENAGAKEIRIRFR